MLLEQRFRDYKLTEDWHTAVIPTQTKHMDTVLCQPSVCTLFHVTNFSIKLALFLHWQCHLTAAKQALCHCLYLWHKGRSMLEAILSYLLLTCRWSNLWFNEYHCYSQMTAVFGLSHIKLFTHTTIKSCFNKEGDRAHTDTHTRTPLQILS